jgi:hypothetical protein
MSTSLTDLEKRLTLLEQQFGKVKPVKPKVPRKPSEYNTFVQTYISSEKKKGTEKSHQELFKEAAKAWSSEKK